MASKEVEISTPDKDASGSVRISKPGKRRLMTVTIKPKVIEDLGWSEGERGRERVKGTIQRPFERGTDEPKEA
ncbi:hypothetical protein DLJ53_18030 [Acuticoccus sediminis]|uniref:Uncharacterized protein n=1 Tax=Acuticoccus sediminis TaxID=2184697 RepID=A0A8B2NUY3_9HYPH|nr:hypothetical protein [Acuticoccus sediminis]RAI01115.1 hypothetical protein DLJ53_18030 [Acuticoccus sediminis]